MADEYAQFLGIKTSKVHKIVELYNLLGADFMKNLQWGGRRNETSLSELENEMTTPFFSLTTVETKLWLLVLMYLLNY